MTKASHADHVRQLAGLAKGILAIITAWHGLQWTIATIGWLAIWLLPERMVGIDRDTLHYWLEWPQMWVIGSTFEAALNEVTFRACDTLWWWSYWFWVDLLERLALDALRRPQGKLARVLRRVRAQHLAHAHTHPA